MRQPRILIWALLAGTLPLQASAQASSDAPPASNPDRPAAEESTIDPSVPVGGTSAIDFIRIDSNAPSVPLRNAGVVRNSETVELDGRRLERGKDYSLDYGSGMLLLMTPIRPGQSLRVSYRHDPTLRKNSSEQFGQNWNTMRLNFNQGTSVMMGLGMAERTADGSVMRSNLYALRNSFGLAPRGGLTMTGMMAFGQRERVQSVSAQGRSSQGRDQGGTGSAIVQDLQSNLGGGQVVLSYQSVDRAFEGFQAFRDAGFTDQQVGQLAKERGLRRVGLSMRNVQVGDLKLNQGLSVVGEKDQSIRLQNFELAGDGWKFDLVGRKVDRGFQRFRDLRDQDREQLQRESGLDTRALGFKVDRGAFKLNANDLQVMDARDNAVRRFAVNSEFGGAKIAFSTQSVGDQFRQFQGLREKDAGQLAREQGIRRQALRLNWSNPSSGLPSLQFSASSMANDSRDFQSRDLTLTGKGWSYDYALRDNDAGFDGLARQSNEEADQHIQRIGMMYQPKGLQTRPEERQWFQRQTGIRREMQRIEFTPGRGLGVTVSSLNLQGARDSGSVTTTDLSWQGGGFSLRRQALGRNLNEIHSMMGFERERLGTLTDLRRTDWSFNQKLGKDGSVAVQQFHARVGQNHAERFQLNWNTTRTQIQYVERAVSPNFFSVGHLIDPERELLGQLIGQEQRQLLINTMLMRDMNARIAFTSARQSQLDQDRQVLESVINWKPDASTQFSWYRYSDRLGGPETLLMDQTIDRMLLSRNFGALGQVSWEQERRDFDGEQNRTADSVRNTVAVEAKVSANTSLRTEQSQTQYNDGNRETVSAHTVSTGLTRGAGISVTDVRIDRSGDRPDERRRNYGFWVQLGGLKFTYGYARALGQEGTLNSNFGVSEGQLGFLKVGGANYQHQRWDDQRNRTTGNLKLGTAKPIQLGFLRDFTFNLGSDSVRDYNSWHRDHQTANVGARIGEVALGFDYVSQVHANQSRAIDRTFRFASDKNPQHRWAVDGMIKVRTLPWGATEMIRNVALTARFIPGFDVIHQLQTLPEVQRPDAPLGSITQPVRTSAWRIQQTNSKADTRFGLSWEERINDQNRQMTRMASVNLTLRANNPSPIRLFYGLEQGSTRGNRSTAHRYGIEFNQRPGPNQAFSVNIANTSWQDRLDSRLKPENWTVRLEYQLRF